MGENDDSKAPETASETAATPKTDGNDEINAALSELKKDINDMAKLDWQNSSDKSSDTGNS